MTYWVGQHLERRVRQFGLEDLVDLLTQIGGGKAAWPGDLSITPAEPELAEQLRITIYSLLHETGMKPFFRVRMAFGSIILEQKSAASRVNISPVSAGQGQGLDSGQSNRYRPEQGVLGDEGLREMLREPNPAASAPWRKSAAEPTTDTETEGLKDGFTLPTGKPLGHSTLLVDQPVQETGQEQED